MIIKSWGDSMNLSLVPKRCVLGCVFCAALAPLVANEASAQGARAEQIEEVVVTARRVEESLQDTPVSVTAFSSEDLEQIGVSEPKDMAKHAPNVTIRKQTSTNNDYTLGIRGVAEAEPALAIDPAVGLYIDEVYIARNAGMAFDIVDLKRIEVLRGPQGTLFGRNTIGGAINIITEKPRGEFSYQLQGGVGDESHDRLKATIDTPTVGGLSAKLSILNNTRDGEVRSIYGGDKLGGQRNRAYRLGLRWAGAEAWSAEYSYTRTEGSGNGNQVQLTHVRPIYADPDGQFYGGPFYEQAAAHADPDRLSQLAQLASDPGLTEITIDGHTLHLEWEASENLTIRSITGYREFEDFTVSEFNTFIVQNDGDVLDGRQLETQGQVSTVPAGTFVPLFRAPRDRQHEQVTQEFQFIGGLFDDKLRFNVGLYYFQEEGFEDNPQEFVLPTALIANFAGGGLPGGLADAISDIAATEGTASATFLARPFQEGIDNKAYAAYGDFTWVVTQNFEITLGGRYTVDERFTSIRNIFDGESKVLDAEDEWNNFNPSLTFDYRWSDEVSTYAKVATGYRSGGFNVRATTEESFKTPFDPETLTNYEVGLKSDLLARKLRLNGALFHYSYEDRQVAAFEAGTGGASSKIVNAGESTTTGLELEAIYIPWAGTRIIANYGYQDVEFKEFISGELDPVTGFPTGRGNIDIADDAATNRYAPESSGSLAIEHSLDPWSFGRLTLRVDGTYTGSISFHPQLNRFDSSRAHTLFNARATLADIPVGSGNLRLALWGKNLTNEEYRDFGIDFGILGFTVNTYAPLTSYGFDLIYAFNR